MAQHINISPRARANRLRQSVGDRIFAALIFAALILVNLIMLYPLVYVFSTSISSPSAVVQGRVLLWPVGFDTSAYAQILKYPYFLTSYGNTLFYAFFGTLGSLFMLVITAYPLATDTFHSRKYITMFYVITMFISGGMIPTFLVVKGVGLYNSRLAMIIPSLLSAWNIVICKNFFESIPRSLHESAYLDGASDWVILWRIVLPLSKAVLATLALFCIVAYWNNFFSALLYLNDRDKYPLQMILRGILMNAEMTARDPSLAFDENSVMASTLSLKTASVVVTILPVLCVYPFIQKYFVKGVMIGSVKG